MSFLDLPLDSQISLLMNLSPKDLSHYCQSSSEIYSICQSPEFANEYIIRKFRVVPERLPGRTFLGKLRGHELIVRAHFSNISSPDWVHQVGELLDDTLELGDPEVLNRVLEAIKRSYTGRIKHLESSGANLNDHRNKVKKFYQETFLKAREYGDPETIQSLLQYSPYDEIKNYTVANLISS